VLTPRLLRLMFRVAFAIYFPVLLLGTHWPALEVPGPGRSDLLVHLVAFGLWTALLIGAGLFGPALSWRNVGMAFAVGAAYSAVSEATQALPFIRRHAAFDDFLANLLGVLLTCCCALLLMTFRSARGVPAGSGPMMAERTISK
jgi:hypothetical protein